MFGKVGEPWDLPTPEHGGGKRGLWRLKSRPRC